MLPDLSRDEISRYARHLIIPDVGIEGQKRLKAARVLLVGMPRRAATQARGSTR